MVTPGTASRTAAALPALPAREDMSEKRLELADITDKWTAIRHMDRAEAEKTLEGEWLEAFNRFYARYDEDMTKMEDIAERLQKLIEPPQIAKKSKSQRKRDRFAIVVEREAIRAANAK